MILQQILICAILGLPIALVYLTVKALVGYLFDLLGKK